VDTVPAIEGLQEVHVKEPKPEESLESKVGDKLESVEVETQSVDSLGNIVSSDTKYPSSICISHPPNSEFQLRKRHTQEDNYI
jgi:predicted aconitase